jgi:hypothetical protein
MMPMAPRLRGMAGTTTLSMLPTLRLRGTRQQSMSLSRGRT